MLVRARGTLGGTLPAPRRERVDAFPQQRKERGQERECDEPRERRDNQPADRHRTQERKREHEQRGERGGDRHSAERDRPAGGRQRRTQGVPPRPVANELLSIARDQQQAVIDREPDRRAGDEIEREHRDRRHGVDEAQQCKRRKEREQPGGDGQQRSDQAPEDPEREHEEQREGDQLGPQEIAFRLRIHLFVCERGPADEPGKRMGERLDARRICRPVRLEPGCHEHVPSVPRDCGARLHAADIRLRLQPLGGHNRLARRRDDDQRRAREHSGRARKQLQGAKALRAAVLEVVVARLEPRRGRHAERGSHHDGEHGSAHDRTRTVVSEVGKRCEHPHEHNA